MSNCPPCGTTWAVWKWRGARRQLPRRSTQHARNAELALRFGPVTLKPTHQLQEPPLALRAVSLREATPVPGVKGVDWLLLTNVATTDLAAAQERVRWYRARWGI